MNTLLALPLYLLASAGDETTVEFSFAAAEGTSLQKFVQTDQYMRLDKLVLTVDGNPQTPDQTLELATTQLVRVTDDYTKVADGRPTSLRRTYDRVGFSGAAEVPAPNNPRATSTVPLTGKSALERVSVVNTWVPELGEYGRYYDREDPGEELLKGLRTDMDFRELLPPTAVKEGERWNVDVQELRDVLAAGGELPFHWDTGGDPSLERLLSSGVGGSLSSLFPEELKGKAHGLFQGTRFVEQTEVGVIEFEFDLELHKDQTEEARLALTVAELTTGVEVVESGSVTHLSGRGELLWNLQAGHAHSMTLSCSSRIERKETFEAPTQMRRGSVTRQMSLNGQVTVKATVTPGK